MLNEDEEEITTQDENILDIRKPSDDTRTEEYKRLLDSVDVAAMVKLSSPRQIYLHENSVDPVSIYVDHRNIPS